VKILVKIDPTAVVNSGVEIGKGVEIGPFAILDSPGIKLEDGVKIKSHVVIEGNVTIGKNTTIWPFASIGSPAQDLKFFGEKTYVKIGESCNIREYVTINSSCGEGTFVVVGDHSLLMAYCHIAHNCIVGNHCVIANGTNLAGHVVIGDYVVIGGMCGFHQHVRVGSYAMVGGMSSVFYDFPPFLMGKGNPVEIGGLNLIGLKRRQIPLELRRMLNRIYRITFHSDKEIKNSLQKIEDEYGVEPLANVWLDFFRESRRGVSMIRLSKQSLVDKVLDKHLVST